MKETAAAVIAVLFAVAVCVGFFMKMIPLDLFSVLATAAIVWAVGQIQQERILRSMKDRK